jgi:molecular chaperone GrpE
MANESKNQDKAPNLAPGESAATASAEMTADQEMELVRSELGEARDKMLRAQAELDNYRKRARREMDDERRYAEINLLRDLLPVQDNIVRAIDAADKKADAAALLEGLKMVRRQLADVLKRHRCEPIAGQGKPFNPAMHEAVMQQPSAEHEENTVLDIVQSGYHLHDRVVRPAQVIVSKKP